MAGKIGWAFDGNRDIGGEAGLRVADESNLALAELTCRRDAYSREPWKHEALSSVIE